MSIADLMRTPVQTTQASATIAEAARQMVKHSVGALVIIEGSRPVGLVTDRDLVTMVSEGMDPNRTPLDSLIRKPLVTGSVDDDLGDVTAKMHTHGIRRIPIVDRDGKLAGIVSLDDLLIGMARTVTSLSREMSDVAAALQTEFLHEDAIRSHLAVLKR